MRHAEQWSLAGLLLTAGSVVLFAGLMLGPTPSDEPATALRDINDAESRYIATNVVDVAGVLILLIGFAMLGNLLLEANRSPIPGIAAALGPIIGSVFLLLVLVMESAVDPQIAQRFVNSGGQDAAVHLAVSEAFLDFEDGLFALALLLLMWGFTAIALALRSEPLSLSRPFLVFGAVVSAIAV